MFCHTEYRSIICDCHSFSVIQSLGVWCLYGGGGDITGMALLCMFAAHDVPKRVESIDDDEMRAVDFDEHLEDLAQGIPEHLGTAIVYYSHQTWLLTHCCPHHLILSCILSI